MNSVPTKRKSLDQNEPLSLRRRKAMGELDRDPKPSISRSHPTFGPNGVLIGIAFSLMATTTLCFFLVLIAQKKAERVISSQVKNLQGALAHHGEFRFQNVRANLWERSFSVNNVLFKPHDSEEAIQIGRLSISELGWQTLAQYFTQEDPVLPQTFRLGFDGLRLTTKLLGPRAYEMISNLGYEEINLSAAMSLNIDRLNHSLSFDKLIIQVKDAGRVSASISLANITIPSTEEFKRLTLDLEATRARATGAMTVAIKSFEIRYDDESLVSRLKDYARRSSGTEHKARLAHFRAGFADNCIDSIVAFFGKRSSKSAIVYEGTEGNSHSIESRSAAFASGYHCSSSSE
jgi:hypothetical protein